MLVTLVTVTEADAIAVPSVVTSVMGLTDSINVTAAVEVIWVVALATLFFLWPLVDGALALLLLSYFI